MKFFIQQYIIENNPVNKTVKIIMISSNIITQKSETVENNKIKDYHELLIKLDVLLIADSFETFKNESIISFKQWKKITIILLN